MIIPCDLQGRAVPVVDQVGRRPMRNVTVSREHPRNILIAVPPSEDESHSAQSDDSEYPSLRKIITNSCSWTRPNVSKAALVPGQQLNLFRAHPSDAHMLGTRGGHVTARKWRVGGWTWRSGCIWRFGARDLALVQIAQITRITKANHHEPHESHESQVTRPIEWFVARKSPVIRVICPSGSGDLPL